MNDDRGRVAAELRARAVARLGERPTASLATSMEEAARVRDELEVHQVELEIQVEELLDTRGRLEIALERFADLYEHAPSGYLTVEADGTIREANLAATRLLTTERERLVGARLGAFLVETDRRAFNTFLGRAFDELVVAPCEVRLDGEVAAGKTLLLEASRSAGEASCRVVLMDVSERRRAEEARSALEVELQEAQKMESIGRLAGGVAHDLNNLLSVILAGCELVLEDLRRGDPQRDEVEAIQGAGERAAALTSQLLAFSRRQMLQPRVVDLNAMVESALKMVTPLLGSRIETVWRPAQDLPLVDVDPTQMDRVIMNLCVNAREAMPVGGRITLETSRELVGDGHPAREHGVSPGPHVVLSVSDTGVGMSGETARRAFEPFYTTKTGGLGAGLGLSTAYGLVRQSGGAIGVASQIGLGTTFSVYLPPAQDPARAASTPRLGPPGDRRGHERILLVEDERDFRALLLTILERQGYEVVEAEDAAAALLAGERGEVFDLLLSDVVMPGMSGVALARRLQEASPGLKVLFMSGFFDAPLVREVAERGLPLLQKPLKIRDLLQRLRDVLDGPAEARAGDRGASS